VPLDGAGLCWSATMSSIHSLGNNLPVQPQKLPPTVHRTLAPQNDRTDKIDLSGVSHLLGKLKSNEIRAEKVAAIRQQIEDRTYETDQKLDIAVDRLLDDMAR
jgi:anti-sigma28 factor (negative regulator of flagellin synthesis)